MRRRRFLKGSLRARKYGRQKVWLAQWWEDGSRRTKILGRYSDIPKSEAEMMLSQIVQPLNKEAGKSQVPLFTFKHYVENKFLPVCRRMWKESTRITSESNIIRYLLPAFQSQRLETVTREQMQTFLEDIAGDLSSSVVGHLRWHLNAIFKMAQSDGIVSHNPAGALYIPECKASPTKRAMSPHQVRTALGVLDLRPRLIFRLAIFSGLRPGEIFAIRLGKIGDDSITIDQRVYEGKSIHRRAARERTQHGSLDSRPRPLQKLNCGGAFYRTAKRMPICFRQKLSSHRSDQTIYGNVRFNRG
jgi:hypothetical protein